MPRLAPLALALVAAGLALAPAARAQERILTTVERPTDLREQDGAVLFSAFDAQLGAYRLKLVDAAGVVLLLSIAPSRTPFDADLGTTADGGLAAIVAREAGPGSGSDLFVVPVVTGPGLRPVRPVVNANTPGDETAPTLDRGRVAFARTTPTSGPTVYTRRLDEPRTVRSRRLPGVPARRCEVGPPNGDCTTVLREVRRLELVDGALAQSVRYGVGRRAQAQQHEVRLVTLADRRARQVAFLTSGESAQSFLGVGFAGSRLSWHRASDGPSNAPFTAVFRYRPGVGYDVADAPSDLAGFAIAPDGAFLVRGRSAGGCPAGCEIVRTGPPRWARIAAARVRL